VESVRCLPPAPTMPVAASTSTSRSNTTRSRPCSTSRARNLLNTLGSKPGSVSSNPRAYFQSIARATIDPAWRSVRFSTYCNTVTSANAPGDSAGAPRVPNAAANCSSPKTSASSSRALIAGLPFGNAARATDTVWSGTRGAGRGRIDTTHLIPRPGTGSNDRKQDHSA